jgi:DNA-binding LytR/AlgR family response regulator
VWSEKGQFSPKNLQSLVEPYFSRLLLSFSPDFFILILGYISMPLSLMSKPLVSNVSIASEKAFTEAYQATGNSFDIMMVDSTKKFSLALARDLRFLNLAYSSMERVVSLSAVYSAIEKKMPHLVILSLNLPDSELLEFLSFFPAQSRPFAVMFIETFQETAGQIRSNLRQISRSANMVAEQEAVGYYLIGTTTNEELGGIIGRARAWVQHRLWKEYQELLIEGVNKYLQHSLVAAQPAAFRHSTESESVPVSLDTVFSGELRYRMDDVDYIVPFDRIVWVEGDGKYCQVSYYDNHGALRSQYLPKTNIIDQLPAIMLKVHTSYWVNIAYIRHLLPEGLELLTHHIIPLSRRERETVKEVLYHTPPSLFLLPLLQKMLHKTSHFRPKPRLCKRKRTGGGGDIKANGIIPYFPFFE